MPAQWFLSRLIVASVLLAPLIQAGPVHAAPPPRRQCQTIERKLAAPVSLNFHDAPLQQVVADLRAFHAINIVLDRPALQEDGVSLNTPVSVQLEDVPLKSALNLILHNVHLAYVVKDDVLHVTTPTHARGKLMTRTYQVADLVIPVRNGGDLEASPAKGCTKAQPGPMPCVTQKAKPCACATATTPARPATEEDKLIGLIQSTIAPQSWACVGGPGTVDYCPLTMTLVVNQTPDVHEQVSDLLGALRREQDQEVAFEVRFLTVSDDLLEWVSTGMGLQKNQLAPAPAPGCGGASQPTWTAFLSNAQVRQLLEQIQGDQHSNVMQAPKLTVFNGQRAALNVTDTQRFVTGIHLTTKDGQVVFLPQTEEVPLGVKLAVEPAISADRRFVRMKLDAMLTSLVEEPVPVFPVAVPVKPVAGSKENAAPVGFTQFIQQPHVNRAVINTALAIPDGGTVLLGGIRQFTRKHSEYGPPVLSKIPYVSRLFKTVGYSLDAENVVVMVTPRIVTQEEEEVRQTGCQDRPQAAGCPAECSGGKLGTLLLQYHEACAAGRADEARKLAIECLAIDPTCFHAP
jgi:general secretion pathway protein D